MTSSGQIPIAVQYGIIVIFPTMSERSPGHSVAVTTSAKLGETPRTKRDSVVVSYVMYVLALTLQLAKVVS